MRPGSLIMIVVVAAFTTIEFARPAVAADPAVKSNAAVDSKRVAAEGWKLTWRDEFDGPEIDKTKWDFDRGNGFKSADSNEWIAGWGNGELEFYTNRPQNAFINDGQLHLRAIKESYKGFSYT